MSEDPRLAAVVKAPVTVWADPPWLDKVAQMAMCAWCPYGMLPPMDNDHYWDSWRSVVRAVHAFIAVQVVSSQIDSARAEARRDAARVKQMEKALGAAKDFIVLEELAPAEHVFEIHKRAEVRAKIYAMIDVEIAREEKDSGHEK